MMEQLENLVDEDIHRGMRFMLLKRSECADVTVSSRRHWMDRMDGGERYWEVSA
jgi:hypothetical protein